MNRGIDTFWRAVWLALLLATVFLANPSLALAAPSEHQLSEASQHFQRGKTAFADKRYGEAARAFDEAFKLVPDAGTAFNAALAWERAKDPARAADAYVHALKTEGLDAPRAADAERALAKTEAELARVVVRTNASARVTLAYRDEAAPLVVHLKAGRYDLVATFADGSRAVRSIDVDRAPLELEIVPPLAQTERPVAPPSAPALEPSDPGAVRRIVGFVSLGLGAAGGATAIALGVLGVDARDDFDATGRTSQALHDKAVGLRLGANIAWGIAGAFTVTGIVLVATSFGGEDSKATAALCAGLTRVAFCGSF